MDERLTKELEGILDKLTDEQKEKVLECNNEDEFSKLLGDWGIELPDELVESVAGGEARLMNDGLFKRLKRYLKL